MKEENKNCDNPLHEKPLEELGGLTFHEYEKKLEEAETNYLNSMTPEEQAEQDELQKTVVFTTSDALPEEQKCGCEACIGERGEKWDSNKCYPKHQEGLHLPNCEHSTPLPEINGDWEEELEKVLEIIQSDPYRHIQLFSELDKERLKSVTKSTLAHHSQEIKRRIEEVGKAYKPDISPARNDGVYHLGYDQAIKDILSTLTNPL